MIDSGELMVAGPPVFRSFQNPTLIRISGEFSAIRIDSLNRCERLCDEGRAATGGIDDEKHENGA